MVPVFTANRSISLAPSFAPAASPRLRRSPTSWPPHRRRKPASESTTQPGWSCTAPRPLSTRFEPATRLRSFITGSSRIPSDLACRTQPVWQSQTVPALSALLPTFPGVSRVRLRSASPGRCDGPAGRTYTSLGSCEVDSGRPTGVATGGFPRAASRTRRAPFSAPGSPQVSLVWISSTRRSAINTAASSSSVFTGDLLAFQPFDCPLAGPLRHVRASRALGLLRGLRPTPCLQPTTCLSRPPEWALGSGNDAGWFPCSLRTDRSAWRPAMPRQHRHDYTAVLRRGLPAGTPSRLRSWPPSRVVMHCTPAHIHQI